MRMKQIVTMAAAVGLIGAFASSLKADAIPYPTPGVEAPATFFTAITSGDIIAYFYATDAGYDSEIGMLVNGVSTGVFGLPNHSSSHGDMLDLGHANAGDTIVFQLHVITTGDNWYSDPGLNSDGHNHAYATSFSGDADIPPGTYVGFEDLPNGAADYDYNDHQFVFVGVSMGVPEAGSTLLLSLLGLAPLVLLRRLARLAN